MAATATPSGVLAALFERDGDTVVILTRRSWELRHHAGEVSFPGGRSEPGDSDLYATAVREAQEEIGLDPASVEFVAPLDSITTVSGQSLIVPFVATLAAPPELVAEPGEVDEILEVSFAELLSSSVWREELWALGGLEMPMRFFELANDTVWGATAVLLRQLLGIAVGLERSDVAPSGKRWQAVADAVRAAGLAGPDPL